MKRTQVQMRIEGHDRVGLWATAGECILKRVGGLFDVMIDPGDCFYISANSPDIGVGIYGVAWVDAKDSVVWYTCGSKKRVCGGLFLPVPYALDMFHIPDSSIDIGVEESKMDWFSFVPVGGGVVRIAKRQGGTYTYNIGELYGVRLTTDTFVDCDDDSPDIGDEPRWGELYPCAPRPAATPMANKDAVRKGQPIATGVLDYFPSAIAKLSEVSRQGNEQHNPGQPMHWSYDKSTNHADSMMRHLLERRDMDDDGIPHVAKVAWRALAMLQTYLEDADPELHARMQAQRAKMAQGK